MKKPHVHKGERGIVIILALLLVAAISALVFATSFSTQNQLRQSQLQQEEERKLREAQSQVEKTLQQKLEERVFKGLDVNPSAEYTDAVDQTFTTESLRSGDMVTVYLVPIDSLSQQRGLKAKNPSALTLTPPGGACLELTVIGSPVDLPPAGMQRQYAGDCSTALEGVATSNVVNISGGRLLLARMVTGGGPITFSGPLPPQGESDLGKTTSGGVQKDVSVYKSYPQLPINFFVTQF